MTTDRWDPFRDMMTFREAMDRWLQQSISGTGQLLSNMRPESMPVDVVERDDSFELRAAVPGVKPEDVEVTVQGERVTLRAESRAGQEQEGDNWLMREQRYGQIQRSITLPSPVSSENAEARIEYGVLALRLPKIKGAAPRRIAVAASAGSSTSPTPQPSAPGSGVPEPGHAHGAHHGSRDHTAEGDKVTEESQESFPSSDPPSWTPERT
ncbi:MAG: Hsp20/alpha crystallin family protein [Chloroflexota bacterium]|nr:Hsp20/alpha crystallin family protein [Chloroflexota bacterium]